MSEPNKHDPLLEPFVPEPISVAPPLGTTQTDPALSSQLRANCDALRNDLLQAQELAGDFQSQLSGKSNEAAHFKQLLEKTQAHLERLQTDIQRLREERHGLANDVMRLQAIELQKAHITGERNRLAAELDSLRRGLAAGEEDRTRRSRERGRQETILNLQVQVLRKQLQALRSSPGIPQRIATCDPTVRSELETLGRAVHDLMTVQDEDAAARPSGLDPICGSPAVSMNYSRDEIVEVAFEK